MFQFCLRLWSYSAQGKCFTTSAFPNLLGYRNLGKIYHLLLRIQLTQIQMYNIYRLLFSRTRESVFLLLILLQKLIYSEMFVEHVSISQFSIVGVIGNPRKCDIIFRSGCCQGFAILFFFCVCLGVIHFTCPTSILRLRC